MRVDYSIEIDRGEGGLGRTMGDAREWVSIAVSFGVQDIDPTVQRRSIRLQGAWKQTQAIMDGCAGPWSFARINIDLILRSA